MATIGQRVLNAGQTRRGFRKWVLHKSNATGPQPSRPAETPIHMPYGVHMRNTSGPGRGTWATYIKAAREHARLTKTELARRISKDRATVGRWEDGKNRPEDANLVALIADVLNLDIDEALAAAGLRPGVEAPPTPTVELDEEEQMVLAADVDEDTRREALEQLHRMRMRDRQRRMEDLEFLLRRRRRGA